jgi:orotate phosphoribosyltransferase
MATPSVQEREELARDVSAAALLRGEFTLRSGKKSSFYLDKYLFETQPAILRRVAKQIAAMLPAGTERIAGPELGAVALATAVSLESGIPFLIVRKAEKEYGASAGKPYEGKLEKGEKVVVVEDVVTTGGEAIRSAKLLRELGAEVIDVIYVLDRGAGGKEGLEALGFPAHSLFTSADLGIPTE